MEFLTQLRPIDLFIVAALAGGILAGFTAGMIRYGLNALVVLAAFVIASQLHTPIFEALGFWDAFTPAFRDQILFLLTFVALVVGGWFIVRAVYRRTRLPIIRQLDEIGGALLGLLFATLSIILMLVVMDSFFTVAPDSELTDTGILGWFYQALNESIIVQFFREALIPVFGTLLRPLVPADIARLLVP